MEWLPFSYLLHDNAVRTRNVGGFKGPALALDGVEDKQPPNITILNAMTILAGTWSRVYSKLLQKGRYWN